jgi:hypothetical protein
VEVTDLGNNEFDHHTLEPGWHIYSQVPIDAEMDYPTQLRFF